MKQSRNLLIDAPLQKGRLLVDQHTREVYQKVENNDVTRQIESLLK